MSYGRRARSSWSLAALLVAGGAACAVAHSAAITIPAATVDDAVAAHGAAPLTAVVSGGCFWGIQAVFQHVKGVVTAVSGYAGGAASTAHYEMVSTGETGHAESVQVTYDPAAITYGQLLHVFFSVAHDPTTLNEQGPDVGTQYRSVVWFANDDQARIGRAYIAQLDKAGVFASPIVTTVTKLPAFYPAEDYHQNYATLHPYDMYIVVNDAPKVANLKRQFPALYVEK